MNETCKNCHEMTSRQQEQIRDLLKQFKRQEITISILALKCDELVTEKGEAAKTAQDNNSQLIASVDLVKEISKNADHAARSLLRLSNSLNVAVMSAAAKSARDERARQQGDADSSAAGSAEPSASERDK